MSGLAEVMAGVLVVLSAHVVMDYETRYLPWLALVGGLLGSAYFIALAVGL